MKQVVAIHGGGAFASYEKYLSALKNEKVTGVDWFKPGKDWKTTLQDTLGANYEVLLPRMPNKQNAKYLEWKIWFEKLLPFLKKDAILIGHSLGGSFLAKYLTENKSAYSPAAVMLVATPHDKSRNPDGLGSEFVVPPSHQLLAAQGGKIFLYHSKDDKVVPFTELAKFQKALPNATARIFEDRGHFNQEQFPELVADIKSL